MKILIAVLSTWFLATTTQASIIYHDRNSFIEHTSNHITDDYQNEAYTHGDAWDWLLNDKFTNHGISSIMNETQYQTTGHTLAGNSTAQYTDHSPDRYYCGGCNGSFKLLWTNTSIDVNAVGLDIASNYSYHPYHAYITYSNGNTENQPLPLEQTAGITHVFWGLYSPLGIHSIHFGKPNGGITTEGSFAIDNLTIAGDKLIATTAAAVPEPALLWLFFGAVIYILNKWRNPHERQAYHSTTKTYDLDA